MLPLLLLLLALSRGVAAVCPAGYTQINGADCFKLFATQRTYDDADADCKADGGRLAAIHNANEQAGLAGIMGASTPLIGLKCTDAVVTNCRWADGSPVDYSNFVGGAPSVAFGSCVHLELEAGVIMWYPWNCGASMASFLCRVPFDTPPPATCTGDYEPYNGGCAALKKTLRSQAEAEAACVLDGGHLASIHSEADNLFYQSLATKNGVKSTIYTGLAWNTQANAYTWSDGSANAFNKFVNPFPNLVFGDCVQMMLSTEFGTLGQWTNINCLTDMASACWKENGGTPTKAPAACPPIDYFFDQGTIYSPNFPLVFPAGQACEYVLVTALGTKVSVSFPVFGTDAGSSLALYDGLDDVTPRTKLSGATVDPKTNYESATNIMKMIFTASATPAGQGFQANFKWTGGPDDPVTFAPVDPTGKCPQQLYQVGQQGIYLYSPNWPAPYPPMADCLYYVRSAENKKLSIQFGYMDTEQCCDYVAVYDGPSNTSPLLVRVSGRSDGNAQLYYSTGPTLTLEFFSDSIEEGQGWIATVREV